ncbi:MAG: dihydroorotate dehydrogenase electron transfer subunit [Euzebyales bacterium]|nr:dihydroorotate dehydrogenase electron transfer subunit [Euzebyales bacterium]
MTSLPSPSPPASASAGVVNRGSPSPRGSCEGPLRALCEVLSSRRVGAYHSVTVVAPAMAERARPGQFVSVGVSGEGTLLRRPFSIYSVSRHGPWAGTIEIAFDVVGPGTAYLAHLVKHDVVDVVGPLGRAFPVPQQQVGCLLVGGGYGAAPLLYLSHTLRRAGLRVDVVMGAATQERLFNAIEAKRVSTRAAFTTEDGSFGTRGRVTDVLDHFLEGGGVGVVYACGPMPMLAAVSQAARRHKVAVQVAVEEAMACGVGVCMTCVLPYHRDGGVVNLRACVEGPVFNGKRVQWDRIGRQPAGEALSAGQAVAGSGGDRAQG